MFSSSLRKRKDWTEISTELLSQSNPIWKEITSETYDLAIPINTATNNNPTDYIRLIILSPADTNKSLDTQDRVENLYHKWGGKNVGVLFLLNGSNQENGSIAMMSLQARQVKTLESPRGLTKFITSFFYNVDIPILPLFDVKSLQSTLSSFLQHIEHPLKPIKGDTSAITLLPYCSTNPPMQEHARNIISDICANIHEFGILMSTDQRHQILGNLLSDYPRTLQEIIDFWQEENFTE
ncbi:BgTH12-05819 [Blumeria graminis f. sp. triticale]|uniref:BgtA-21409 n=3 Tax=Blumeria graminis TaxID=34373 RepID=A0A9X9MKU9_BLUGR|nr:hypothetical protein BGT96224_A21409 [Blumeria graminis f. sp. tritici 96224]CAD6504082.1 BgTH12-05819 [Blumeria graminis f. sp. triticale]VDB90817.1 BgtA-21409 [Blumeria graminis f. sp. tritici]